MKIANLKDLILFENSNREITEMQLGAITNALRLYWLDTYGTPLVDDEDYDLYVEKENEILDTTINKYPKYTYFIDYLGNIEQVELSDFAAKQPKELYRMMEFFVKNIDHFVKFFNDNVWKYFNGFTSKEKSRTLLMNYIKMLNDELSVTIDTSDEDEIIPVWYNYFEYRLDYDEWIDNYDFYAYEDEYDRETELNSFFQIDNEIPEKVQSVFNIIRDFDHKKQIDRQEIYKLLTTIGELNSQGINVIELDYMERSFYVLCEGGNVNKDDLKELLTPWMLNQISVFANKRDQIELLPVKDKFVDSANITLESIYNISDYLLNRFRELDGFDLNY